MRLSPLERLQARIARLLLRLPRRIAGPPIVREGRTLDGQAQIALAAARWARRPALHAGTVAAARRELEISSRVLAPRAPRMQRTDERTVAGPAGPIPLRIHRPAGVVAPAPALVFLHGGGHVTGSLDSHDSLCRVLAAEASCVVIAVDYRLAPEHRFPAALDDAVAAFRAVARDAASLGLDPGKLAVGGDSAGGNLSAVVALETRSDPVRPVLQLLFYPVVDLTMSFPSVASMGKGFFLEEQTVRWFRAHYLPASDRARDPRASPWFADDLSGVPSAFVTTAGFDPLRDEGDAYARRLREAGVAVEHRCYDSLFHGYLATAGSIRAAREALSDAVAALVRAFEPRVVEG